MASANDHLLDTAASLNAQLQNENRLLRISVEKYKLEIERKDIQLQKIKIMYKDLWEKYEREMGCYRETVDYMKKSLASSSLVNVSQNKATTQFTLADKAEQLARSLNMDIFK